MKEEYDYGYQPARKMTDKEWNEHNAWANGQLAAMIEKWLGQFEEYIAEHPGSCNIWIEPAERIDLEAILYEAVTDCSAFIKRFKNSVDSCEESGFDMDHAESTWEKLESMKRSKEKEVANG